jgi:F-type H+-transporting ATPase subunit b
MQLTSLAARVLATSPALASAVVLVTTALPAHASDKLNLEPNPVVTVVLLVAFIAIILPLNNLIFKPLIKVMEEREERIDGARSRAVQVQAQAQQAIERYEESIRVAHDEANAERRRRIDTARGEQASVTQRARAEADREIGRAREELQASLGEARASLRGGAEDLATLAAERILGRSLS